MPAQKAEPRKPSVAIIGTRGYPSYYGGFETAVRRLAPFLAELGWEVTVYGRKGQTSQQRSDRDDRVVSRVTGGLETKSLSTLSYGFSSALDAMWRRPDVALVMNVANGYWLPLLKLRGIPTLVNVDGIEWDRAKWGRLAKAVFYGGAKATARSATRLVFDAEAIAARWRETFDRDGEVIPYGGDESSPLAVQPGLTHRGYILMVARFVPENTIPEFLKAVPTLRTRWPIVIVGSSGHGGAMDDDVRALAASGNNVRWLGHISDDAQLHSLWQHAGAYFHGHSVGGTNPALVQAMALGAPVVARDTIYNREVLGDTPAILVRPNAIDIAQGLDQMMKSSADQERASEQGIRRARQAYSWQLVCSMYEASLADMAASRLSGAGIRRRSEPNDA